MDARRSFRRAKRFAKGKTYYHLKGGLLQYVVLLCFKCFSFSVRFFLLVCSPSTCLRILLSCFRKPHRCFALGSQSALRRYQKEKVNIAIIFIMNLSNCCEKTIQQFITFFFTNSAINFWLIIRIFIKFY